MSPVNKVFPFATAVPGFLRPSSLDASWLLYLSLVIVPLLSMPHREHLGQVFAESLVKYVPAGGTDPLPGRVVPGADDCDRRGTGAGWGEVALS